MESFVDVPSQLTTFATNTMNIDTDIKGLQASITDAMMMGDQVVGQQGHRDVIKQSKDRNAELKNNKEELEKDIRKKESIVNRSNRDFSDVKDSLPQTLPNKTLNMIEDYTMAVLSIAYLFMILSFIWWYASTSSDMTSGLLRGSLMSGLGTMIFLLVMYYVV
jgi:hypothetical protein